MDRAHSGRQQGLAAYYDGLASVYGEGEVFNARRHAILGVIQPEVSTAQRLLDLGCGNATYAAAFKGHRGAAQIVGLDLSPAMLATAQQRLGGSVALARGEATALPFRTGVFDVVFMSHVLQLIDDVERLVQEVAAVLSATGAWISTFGVTSWRRDVLESLGPDALNELASVVGIPRSGLPGDDEARVMAACRICGLDLEWRHVTFSVAWPAVEEWIRIRWLTVADDATRERGERWLVSMRSAAAGLVVGMGERVLVARRI